MNVLPAIDLRNGNVVRLAQGDYDRETVYSGNPLEVARYFAACGCEWVHVVDLDAARSGQLTNLAAVLEIVARTEIRVELGGGIRDDRAIDRALEAGVDRLVVGSAAVKNWPWFERLLHRPELSDRLCLGLDARDGKLAIHGWTEQAPDTAADLARRVQGAPLAAIIYTDIARDGMLVGPNFAATAELIAATDVPVIASGGIGSLEDVLQCRKIGCAGAIVGRAYYEGKIDLAEAVAAAAGRR